MAQPRPCTDCTGDWLIPLSQPSSVLSTDTYCGRDRKMGRHGVLAELIIGSFEFQSLWGHFLPLCHTCLGDRWKKNELTYRVHCLERCGDHLLFPELFIRFFYLPINSMVFWSSAGCYSCVVVLEGTGSIVLGFLYIILGLDSVFCENTGTCGSNLCEDGFCGSDL